MKDSNSQQDDLAGERSRTFALTLTASTFVGVLLALVLIENTVGWEEFKKSFHDFQTQIIQTISSKLPFPSLLNIAIEKWLRSVILAPHLILPAMFLLVLERLIPARSSQKVFSISLLQDFLWMLLHIGFLFWAINWFRGFLGLLFNTKLPFLTFQVFGDNPGPTGLLVAFLAADFLGWFAHFVRHKVTWFWTFHAVHHSQTQLNMNTVSRFHVVESLTTDLTIFLPFYVLAIPPVQIAEAGMFITLLSRAYHSNIRSNFGILRYILVTPQSHRIHHSVHPEHVDTNFGLVFSIWDRIFGTHSPDETSYPDTGIDDAHFPQESTLAKTLSFQVIAAQFLYPFRQILSKLGGKSAVKELSLD